jgi:hypothetical protein
VAGSGRLVLKSSANGVVLNVLMQLAVGTLVLILPFLSRERLKTLKKTAGIPSARFMRLLSSR